MCVYRDKFCMYFNQVLFIKIFYWGELKNIKFNKYKW